MIDATGHVVTYSTIVGQVLAKERKRRGLTQADVAEHVGLSQSSWCNIERGARPLTVDRLYRVCNTFGLKVSAGIIEVADRVSFLMGDDGFDVVHEVPPGRKAVPASVVSRYLL